MSQILNTAAVGLQTQQKNIDTIANNIANLNTAGFKRERLDFADTIYQAMQENSGLTSPVSLQLGYGSIVNNSQIVQTAGSLEATGRAMDLAIDGNGFFMVENADGSRTFTRQGNLQSQEIAGQFFLVTGKGQFVLDSSGNRIQSITSFEQAGISTSGHITLAGQAASQIGLFDFSNPSALEPISDFGFLPTDLSGPAQIADSAQIRQGALESSNVDLGEEMTRLMTAQRAYALLTRAITTADEMRATENDIRR